MNTEAFLDGYMAKESARGDYVLKMLAETRPELAESLLKKLKDLRYQTSLNTRGVLQYPIDDELYNMAMNQRGPADHAKAVKMYRQDRRRPEGWNTDALDALLSHTTTSNLTGRNRSPMAQEIADRAAQQLREWKKTKPISEYTSSPGVYGEFGI
jgi:hypothetical protein